MELEGISQTKYKRRRHRRSNLSSSYYCAVCGDKSMSYNFGVPACEGCKGFYRRHWTRMASMVCLQDNNCEITVETRKSCLACRMRKCCEVGMQRDPLTKDPVMKPRRTRAKPPGEKQRPGRKPGSKVRPKESKKAAANVASHNDKANSTKQTSKTKPAKAKGDFMAGTMDRPSSSSCVTSAIMTSVATQFASSAQHQYSNVCSEDEQHTGENGVLAYAYLLANPSSVCTYVSQVTGSPRSVSSVPPKKRKLVTDGVDGSPCTSQNDIGVWGNSFAQLSTRSDADSNQLHAYDTSCKVQYGYEVSNEPSLSVASLNIVQRAQQIGLGCNEPQLIIQCGNMNEDQRNRFPLLSRPTTAVERMNDLASGLAHDLEADCLYEISEPVYEQIMADCVNLAATMNAAWRRDELGATLYDDPHISDARYHMRYMELRIHRLVFALKQSRCFSTLTDAEKFVLIKTSLPRVMIPLQGYCYSEDCNSVIERFDDGRVIERLLTDYFDMFAQYDIDMWDVFYYVREFHLMIRGCPLVSDLPILLSILVVLIMFQVSVEQTELESSFPSTSSESLPVSAETGGEVRSRANDVARTVFEMKVAMIRREHAAFLRCLISKRLGRNAKGQEMWHFCVSRLNDLAEISKLVKALSFDFFKRRPAMIGTIVPVINEVMGRMVGMNNAL